MSTLPEPVNNFDGVQTLWILTYEEYAEFSTEIQGKNVYVFTDKKMLEKEMQHNANELIKQYIEHVWKDSTAPWKSAKVSDVTYEEANRLDWNRKRVVHTVWKVTGPNKEAEHFIWI